MKNFYSLKGTSVGDGFSPLSIPPLSSMRIEKKNLPASKIRIKDKWALIGLYFLIIFTVTFIIASRKGDAGGTNVEYIGDFFQTKPERGEVSPITWREDGSAVSPNGMSDGVLYFILIVKSRKNKLSTSLVYFHSAYRILIPEELTNAMKKYCDRIGLTELARNFIMSEENNIKPGEYTCDGYFTSAS